MHLIIVVRWIHIISGVSWLGEVITVNFVLIPIALKLAKPERIVFLQNVFPRVFRLASILSATAIASGAVLSYLLTGWRDLGALLNSRWGISILAGGLLGLLLTLFHFFVENRLEPVAIHADTMSDAELDRMIALLKVVPRIGLGIVLLVIFLMMIAARGI
ncbi:MAG: hypothetical protein B6D39_05285 [Anaerolineae bacterium UTCFX2]|jgi:uncharacterized membrane protein|nr:hypothetical protein [Anaerolineae bacterium]MCZ7554037.1 hypothetical protein [Anaerolineales bacterium]OQY92091.1 MAG: hypothetical protein B6D39_05285 [Anaerolineae bacterium UTCFX2]